MKSGTERIQYYVTNCGAGTNAFIQKSLSSSIESLSIMGLPGANLSSEVLETICKTPKRLYNFEVGLKIGKNIDISKLADFLERKVFSLKWEMHEDDLGNQDAAPLDTILDLLDSENHGELRQFWISRELFLMSHWVEQLGGTDTMKKYEKYEYSMFFIHGEHGLELFPF